jgi:nicotinate-nucleotide adenylyltransferase
VKVDRAVAFVPPRPLPIPISLSSVARRLGLFGGTFDPVHHGHLILARDAVEELALDHLIFLPAAVSPHRTEQPPSATPTQRVEMLKLATAGEPHFLVDECEVHRPPPSYTIDTVRDLQSRNPGAEFFFLLGSDQLPRLPTWHRFAELRALVTFVVFRRAPEDVESAAHAYPMLRRRLDLSATELRKRVASGRSLRYLVPDAVAEYVAHHQLYREEHHP